MKKLRFITAFAFLLSPALAHADLQCFTSPSYTASISVQNAAQCVSYDPNGALFDTSSQTWKDPKTGSAINNPRPAPVNTSTSVSGPTTNPNAFCTGGSCTYVPLEPLPGLPTSYGPSQGSFPELIRNSFQLLIGAGALIAVVMIVLGALTYMFSDIAGNKNKALSRIRNAMWAVVLLVSSYLILVTINPDLVKFNLNLSSTNNFNPSPNTTSATTPTQTQPTQAKIQAEQNSCTQKCGSIGGAVHANADGSYTCQCITGSVPI